MAQHRWSVGTPDVYKIDNISLNPEKYYGSAYPTSVSPSHNLVTKSWNNMYGNFVDIPINSKLKVNWIFDCISLDQINSIMGYILNKIRGVGRSDVNADELPKYTRFFNVNTYYPGLGWITSLFYLGTPTNFSSISSNNGTHFGRPEWWKMELHWIEVYGEELNSPTYIPPNTLTVNNREIEVVTPEELEAALNQQR